MKREHKGVLVLKVARGRACKGHVMVQMGKWWPGLNPHGHCVPMTQPDQFYEWSQSVVNSSIPGYATLRAVEAAGSTRRTQYLHILAGPSAGIHYCTHVMLYNNWLIHYQTLVIREHGIKYMKAKNYSLNSV